jgi:hypothetical protein
MDYSLLSFTDFLCTDAFGAGPIALDLKSVASRVERYKPDSHLADVLGHDLSEVLAMEFGNGEFVFTWLTCCGMVSKDALQQSDFTDIHHLRPMS